jgi:hypothetical protein
MSKKCCWNEGSLYPMRQSSGRAENMAPTMPDAFAGSHLPAMMSGTSMKSRCASTARNAGYGGRLTRMGMFTAAFLRLSTVRHFQPSVFEIESAITLPPHRTVEFVFEALAAFGKWHVGGIRTNTQHIRIDEFTGRAKVSTLSERPRRLPLSERRQSISRRNVQAEPAYPPMQDDPCCLAASGLSSCFAGRPRSRSPTARARR